MNPHLQEHMAPGIPGKQTTWTSGAKTGIGKSLNAASSVTFTLSSGILTEVYFPREDIACIRECGLLVTDGKDFFSEERFDTTHEEKMIRSGIPAYRIKHTCKRKTYSFTKEIITDPYRSTVLQKIRFYPETPEASNYSLYVYLTPHIRNHGMSNEGWVGDYKDSPMLFACHDGIGLALACSSGWRKRSVGFAGVSDGVTDIRCHRHLTKEYSYAGKGSIILCGEIDLSAGPEFVLALSFGHTTTDAGSQAKASLLDGYGTSRDRYIQEWDDWQKGLLKKRIRHERKGKYFKESAAVLRMHESKRFPGAILASLSIPWGQARGDKDGSGYHLVWPRDLVESSWGFLALHSPEDALRILNYLMSVQDPDGKWGQNMWLQGDPAANGIQLDQVGFPILLLDTCFHHKVIDRARWARYHPGILRAVSYLVVHGPYTGQDRWEQQAGLSPFTLAVEIAALLAAAFLLEYYGDHDTAVYLRETADHWNGQIEEWTYATGTDTALKSGVDGFYVRINPWYVPIEEVKDKTITVHHHLPGEGEIPIGDLACVDALALVRFGLRAADDPRIRNTVKVIDDQLRIDTPYGPGWRRFMKDAYGEDDKGNPYVDRGRGRVWPLLTGERAHYEIAAGHYQEARSLMKTMEAFSWKGFFPEQVWDAEDIPEKGLLKGRFTGGAMPLTWAHAEYIKLGESLRQKKIFDTPRHTTDRYIRHAHPSRLHVWRFDRRHGVIARDRTSLRIELLAPAITRWSDDGWSSHRDEPTRDSGLGIHYVDIIFSREATEVRFTFYWPGGGNWEGKDFTVSLARSFRDHS